MSETTAVTTASTTGTTQTTSELVADSPPPYMYYSGKTYTSLNKAEETLMSTDDKITERLDGYEFVGNTHEFFNVGEMKSDFDVTSLPDNTNVNQFQGLYIRMPPPHKKATSIRYAVSSLSPKFSSLVLSAF